MSGFPRAFDPSAIRAVAFDAYGTLFQNETPPDYWYARELLERQSLQADHGALERSIREAWRSASPSGLARLAGTSTEPVTNLELQLNGPLPEWRSAWEIWRRQYEIAFAEHGIAGDADDAANYLRDVLARLTAYPDAHDTLNRLDTAGHLLGLLSNADDDFLHRALSRTQLRFSVIQSSESLRIYKPHRAAFLALCAGLGCEPQQVLYAGDSPTSDVLGARNAGLRTAWVRREWSTYPNDLPPPDLEVTSLIEVAGALGA